MVCPRLVVSKELHVQFGLLAHPQERVLQHVLVLFPTLLLELLVNVLLHLLNVLLLGLELLLQLAEPAMKLLAYMSLNLESPGDRPYFSRSSFLMYISSADRSRLVKESLQ